MVLIQSITFHLNLFDLFFVFFCTLYILHTNSLLLHCSVTFNTFRFIFTQKCIDKTLSFSSFSFLFDSHWPMLIHIFLSVYPSVYMQMYLQLSVQLLMMVCIWTKMAKIFTQKTIYLTRTKRKGNDWNLIGDAIDEMIGMFCLIFDKMRKL